MKNIAIFCCLAFMMGALPVCNIRTLTYFALFFIFFRIFIPLMGRDALTTGTVCIFIIFLKYLWYSFFRKNFIKEGFDYWIYLLIFISAVSILLPYFYGTLGVDQMGRAVRLFVGSVAGLLLFLIIKNFESIQPHSVAGSKSDHVESLLALFLILLSTHILISFAIKVYPPINNYLTIFLARASDGIISFDRGGMDSIERIKTFLMTPESYGELLAVLSPIAVYKVFKFRKAIWVVCLILLCVGEVLSVTRSGIILISIGVGFSVFYNSKRRFGQAFILTCCLLMGFAVFVLWFPSSIENVLARFSMATEAYQSGGDVIEVINREGFIPSYNLTVSTLSFFGNGLAPWHFHNLPLTTLYEKGIIGLIVFFTVLLYPFSRLVRAFFSNSASDKSMIFACMLSMMIFFINEGKYEFIRTSSYEQIIWAIIATYYLAAATALPQREGATAYAK